MATSDRVNDASSVLERGVDAARSPVRTMSTRLVGDATTTAVEALRFVGFWAAVALPFLYLPVIVTGVESTEVVPVLVLVALHVLAVFVGHRYERT